MWETEKVSDLSNSDFLIFLISYLPSFKPSHLQIFDLPFQLSCLKPLTLNLKQPKALHTFYISHLLLF